MEQYRRRVCELTLFIPFGKLNTMNTVPMDKAGRLVLPKEVRTRLHLRPGDRFEIEIGPETITLRPQRMAAAGLVRHKTRVIWDAPETAPALEDFEIALRRGWEERDHRAAGI
jgi:AbrB family looped-hinge helix DNA binding protein